MDSVISSQSGSINRNGVLPSSPQLMQQPVQGSAVGRKSSLGQAFLVGGQGSPRGAQPGPGFICLLGHNQQQLAGTLRKHFLEKYPEVSFTTNWCRCLQFGVKIIIDAIKLTHSNPVATPHRKRQEAQTHIGRDVHDEANQPCQGQLLEGSSFIPPNGFQSHTLKSCHDDVDIIVPCPQKAAVWIPPSIWSQLFTDFISHLLSKESFLQDVVEGVDSTQFQALSLMIKRRCLSLARVPRHDINTGLKGRSQEISPGKKRKSNKRALPP